MDDITVCELAPICRELGVGDRGEIRYHGFLPSKLPEGSSFLL